MFIFYKREHYFLFSCSGSREPREMNRKFCPRFFMCVFEIFCRTEMESENHIKRGNPCEAARAGKKKN